VDAQLIALARVSVNVADVRIGIGILPSCHYLFISL